MKWGERERESKKGKVGFKELKNIFFNVCVVTKRNLVVDRAESVALIFSTECIRLRLTSVRGKVHH